MIIFNLYAIVVALFVVLFSIPVFILYHFNIIGEDIAGILISWILLAVSFAAKQSDVNAKLFFIPMWILSIPIPFLVTYKSYGGIGILTTFGIFAAFIGIVFLLLYNSERKQANRMNYAEIMLPSKENPIEFWTKLKDLFFFPSFLKLTHEICEYNLRIAEKLESEKIEMQTLAEFKKEMIAGKNSFDSTVVINAEIKNNFFTEIDDIITHLNKLQAEKAK